MDGILLVDKAAGWTSHDVVAKVRGLLRQELRSKNNELRRNPNSKYMIHNTRGSKIRVGHAGTLDPAATGLLLLLIGSYTKRAGEFSKLDKTYEAEITLGAVSTTGDTDGQITPVAQHAFSGLSFKQRPNITELEAVMKAFTGVIKQIPPAYSAIKIGGQRAYTLARMGKRVQLEPRQVTVYRLQVTEYKYPKLKIVAEVSSGTYIRSLAEDIGEKLGTGAYLSSLRRTQVGNFGLDHALKLDDVNYSTLLNTLQ